MKLGVKGIRTLKLFHLIFAMLWTAGAFGMILITFFILPHSADGLCTKLLSLLLIDNWMIIVGAIATFFIGLIYGWFTNWGFVKHRWVAVKWIITLFNILYGTFAYHPWLIQNIEIAKEMGMDAFSNQTFLANANYMEISGFFQLGTLLFAFAISIYKPWRKKKGK